VPKEIQDEIRTACSNFSRTASLGLRSTDPGNELMLK